nr:hypothetical protein [Cryobacterium sp. TMS1-20-1]
MSLIDQPLDRDLAVIEHVVDCHRQLPVDPATLDEIRDGVVNLRDAGAITVVDKPDVLGVGIIVSNENVKNQLSQPLRRASPGPGLG